MSDMSSNQPNFSLDSMQGQQPAQPQSTQPVTEPVVQPTQQQSQEVQLSEYAQNLLGEIPEADRATVERYLSQWDAGVERRVRQLQSTYAPFEEFIELGYSTDEIQTAARLYDMLNSNPQQALEVLSNALNQGQANPQQSQPTSTQQQQAGQIPTELQQQLDTMNKFMQQQALTLQQQQDQKTQDAQDKALNDYLTLLKREKGEFDEDYVLTKMIGGMDGAAAVDQYNRVTGQQSGRNNSGGGSLPAPPVLSGGSVVPGTKPVQEFSDKERKDLVMSIINTANAQS